MRIVPVTSNEGIAWSSSQGAPRCDNVKKDAIARCFERSHFGTKKPWFLKD